jgi:hypothetical protein
MKRFVDLRTTDVGWRFAWWDTVRDEFESHSHSMAWDSFDEFLEDFDGDDPDRYRRLTPDWAFVPIVSEDS